MENEGDRQSGAVAASLMQLALKLSVYNADIEKLGTRLVELFPERKFGAP